MVSLKMCYPRFIWVVRHCEREDNINKKWRSLPGSEGLGFDNSPLSVRGRQQAMELARRFADEPLAHVFASPFDRTVETAHVIAAANGNKSLKVKAEPGLCEALYLCDKPFPSFWDADELVKKFKLVDTDYDPVFTKHAMPKEGYGDDECVPRLRATIERITKRYAGPILLVGHGASIGAIHEALTGEFKYVGQGTISRFVQSADCEIKLEYSSDASHLSDKRNLRPW